MNDCNSNKRRTRIGKNIKRKNGGESNARKVRPYCRWLYTIIRWFKPNRKKPACSYYFDCPWCDLSCAEGNRQVKKVKI